MILKLDFTESCADTLNPKPGKHSLVSTELHLEISKLCKCHRSGMSTIWYLGMKMVIPRQMVSDQSCWETSGKVTNSSWGKSTILMIRTRKNRFPWCFVRSTGGFSGFWDSSLVCFVRDKTRNGVVKNTRGFGELGISGSTLLSHQSKAGSQLQGL